jgi:hypothetical protein
VRALSRALFFALLLALVPLASAQEPPEPGGGEGDQEEAGEQQEDEPPPVPEGSGTEEPAPAEGGAGSLPAALDPPPEASPERRPAHPAVTWPLSIDAIHDHMRGIAESHANVAALEVLGRSTGGREILVLRLGARDEPEKRPRPVLLLADHLGPTSAGPEVALELAWQACEGFALDERLRALLTYSTLVIAPALDPDARAAPSEPRSAVRFERNFPSGWQPESVRPGSGRIPLSQKETLATASFLTSLDGCAVLLGFTPPAPRGVPYAGAVLPEADREVFTKLGAALELAGAPPLVPWFELGSPGGGPFDFAYQACGMYPLALVLPPEGELVAGGLAGFAAQVATRVLRCLTLLPRVELVREGLERVATDTWQLDVRIQNAGIVPTSSALTLHREPLADVRLILDGAKLVATARRPADGATYGQPEIPRTPLFGGTLAGGEGRWLRLILAGGTGDEVRVTASSPWAGSAEVQVALR